MHSARRLRNLAVTILVLNVALGVVAVVANWPAQFGGVGTDAGDEVLTRGTAISAPVLPVVLLLAVALLAGRSDRWQWVAIGAAYATAVMVAIGGYGEMVAEATDETRKAVLVAAGLGWLTAAALLAAAATAAVVARRRLPAAEEPSLR